MDSATLLISSLFISPPRRPVFMPSPPAYADASAATEEAFAASLLSFSLASGAKTRQELAMITDGMLTPRHFHFERHRVVFSALSQLTRRATPGFIFAQFAPLRHARQAEMP